MPPARPATVPLISPVIADTSPFDSAPEPKFRPVSPVMKLLMVGLMAEDMPPLTAPIRMFLATLPPDTAAVTPPTAAPVNAPLTTLPMPVTPTKASTAPESPAAPNRLVPITSPMPGMMNPSAMGRMNLKMLLNQPNSGRPVSGFMVGSPHCSTSLAYSSLLI